LIEQLFDGAELRPSLLVIEDAHGSTDHAGACSSAAS